VSVNVRHLKYPTIDPFALFFTGSSELSDIMLSEEQEHILNAESAGGKRAVDSGVLTKAWPNGRIPYVMDPKIAGKRSHTSCSFLIII